MSDDSVRHPKHYNAGKIEVIEAIEDWDLNFHRGNAVKYVARAGKKDPAKEIEDLAKACWYLEREIERLKAEKEGRSTVKPNDMKKKVPEMPRIEMVAISRESNGVTTLECPHCKRKVMIPEKEEKYGRVCLFCQSHPETARWRCMSCGYLFLMGEDDPNHTCELPKSCWKCAGDHPPYEYCKGFSFPALGGGR